MPKKIKLILSLTISAFLLLVIFTSKGRVNATTERAVTPSTFITLPASSFVPDESTAYQNESFYIQSNQVDGEFYAPIILPEGSVLRRIILFYSDNNTAGTVQGIMTRLKLSVASPGFSVIGSAETDLSGVSGGLQSMTVQINKDISRYYTYMLKIVMDNDCSVYGARIEYALP